MNDRTIKPLMKEDTFEKDKIPYLDAVTIIIGSLI